MLKIMVGLALVGLVAAGCGNRPLDRAASGAALGATTGAIAGPIGAGTGAVIGAGAGALTTPEDVNLGRPIWRR